MSPSNCQMGNWKLIGKDRTSQNMHFSSPFIQTLALNLKARIGKHDFPVHGHGLQNVPARPPTTGTAASLLCSEIHRHICSEASLPTGSWQLVTKQSSFSETILL